MQRTAGIGFVLIGTLHLALFGRDAWPALPELAAGALWTADHTLLPVAARDPGLMLAEHAFWTTLGSAAVPLFVLGLAVLWIDRKGLRAPVALAAPLVAWSALGSLAMQPSGFPLILFASGLLLAAGLKARRAPRPGTRP